MKANLKQDGPSLEWRSYLNVTLRYLGPLEPWDIGYFRQFSDIFKVTMGFVHRMPLEFVKWTTCCAGIRKVNTLIRL